MTGVKWFGLETSIYAPQGLWTRNLQDMLDQIAATGFNTIRLPFSLVGECGGRSVGQDRGGIWQWRLIEFLKASGLSYTYWSWNPDSGDTGGILKNDWTSLNRAKLELLATYQWPRLPLTAMRAEQCHLT